MKTYLINSFLDFLETHIEMKLLFFQVRSLLVIQFDLYNKLDRSLVNITENSTW